MGCWVAAWPALHRSAQHIVTLQVKCCTAVSTSHKHETSSTHVASRTTTMPRTSSGFRRSILQRCVMRMPNTDLLTCRTCGQRFVSASASDSVAVGPMSTISCARREGTCSRTNAQANKSLLSALRRCCALAAAAAATGLTIPQRAARTITGTSCSCTVATTTPNKLAKGPVQIVDSAGQAAPAARRAVPC